MSQFRRTCGFACLGLLALAICTGTPGQVLAGSIGFVNGTQQVVMVQGSSTDAKGRVRFGQPHKVNPKETVLDQAGGPGPKTITITDPKQPGVILYQGVIQFAGKDLMYNIEPDPNAKGKVKISSTAVPAMMPKK
jgi:hypothetical protein